MKRNLHVAFSEKGVGLEYSEINAMDYLSSKTHKIVEHRF
jgi:hypothetical protein